MEEGFRDAKWYLGFAQARITEIAAWSRMFGLFVIALLVRRPWMSRFNVVL